MKAIIGDFQTDIFPTDVEVKAICKPGEGAETCVWLVLGSNGFECKCLNRPWALYDRWKEGKTIAKRDGCEYVNNFSPISQTENEVEIATEAA